MHIAVTWDISASGENWSSINERMRDVLKPYSWARPLTTFYVVKPESVTLQASILRKAPSALTGAITWSKAG